MVNKLNFYKTQGGHLVHLPALGTTTENMRRA